MWLGATITAWAQKKDEKKDEKLPKEPFVNEDTYSALNFRSIGPAVTSGRISDLAIHPTQPHIWYVAAASGGVWKSSNGGTTFEPLFDEQGSFSIGCLTLDPNNPNVLWVGSGENNNQRSVAYGDGIYKSEDGGKSFTNMGLKNSEHIGKIAIDPRNSNTIYVAAYGPLWSAGGDRGIYKSTDGGKNWKKILEVSENTGFNEIHIDPNNPDVLYATAHQRRRHVWTYISGGPESAIYKSTNSGETWDKLKGGLPAGDVGRISMAIPAGNPDLLYALIEADNESKGLYRSTNRGASWEKQSSHSTAGNYYCEIICDPTNAERIYSMDTWLQVSHDGGKTFKKVGEKTKHVDNHAMWIDPRNPQHWLVGCDGGLYETYDAAATWNFKTNLPITQFYRVAVDNAEPFYNIYGGTQDNNTLGGPSRTFSASGITNWDWFVTVGGDGFEPAIDPTNPDIVYSQWQYGGLIRYDKKSGQIIDIKPQEMEGDAALRWNWDSPLAISHHHPERIYYAANRLFRSDNRGDSWTAISGDLTRQTDRNKLPVMGKVWSVDAVAKNQSTSYYGNIVSFSESPKNENILYAGTDDGLIQVTTDGGKNWTKYERFGGIPENTYISFLLASQYDENTVYAVFNNHKNGDFKPYISISKDKGKTWTALQNNLPERGSVYCIAEDHKNPNLLFAGTEFGLFFTLDGGKSWLQMKGGLPTIAVKDIAIQQRENDLVLATFGRGFYVLDDYSVLQTLKKEDFDKKGTIFSVKDAPMYLERYPLGDKGKGDKGDTFYVAPNPPAGAVFTYFVKDDYKSIKKLRKEREAEILKKNGTISYPTNDSLRLEDNEEAPYLLFVIQDDAGNIVRSLRGAAKKGMGRVSWDFRHEMTSPTTLQAAETDKYDPPQSGMLAIPGSYTVQMLLIKNGKSEALSEAVPFRIYPLMQRTLPAKQKEYETFSKELAQLRRTIDAADNYRNELSEKVKHLKVAAQRSAQPALTELEGLKQVENNLQTLELQFNGDGSLAKREFETLPGLKGRFDNMLYNLFYVSGELPGTYVESMKIVKKQFNEAYKLLQSTDQQIDTIAGNLEQKGAPYIPGRLPKWKAD